MKRKKNSVSIYYSMAIICLVILFTGYNLIEKLSEKRESIQESKVINIYEVGDNVSKKYSQLFAKLMSYFNVFFKETFKEYKDEGLFSETQVFAMSNTGDDKIQNMLDNDDKIMLNIENKSSYNEIDSGLYRSNFDNEKKDIYNVIKLEDIEIYKPKIDLRNNIVNNKVFLSNDRVDSFYTFSEDKNYNGELNNSTSFDNKEIANKINEKYNIIILHTHGTESFKEHKKTNYRTEVKSDNIIGMGKKIATNLQNLGIEVIHLAEYNDLPSYNNSYSNSKKLAIEYMDKNKKNIIIDIHRDGADAESNYEKVLEEVTRIKVNTRYIATFALVVGGANKNAEELKKTSKDIEKIANDLYPGMCRGVIVRDGGKFNQELSDKSILLEIGSHLNSLEEVRITVDFISEILYNYFIKINEQN